MACKERMPLFFLLFIFLVASGSVRSIRYRGTLKSSDTKRKFFHGYRKQGNVEMLNEIITLWRNSGSSNVRYVIERMAYVT
jgi:hypothetical protein